jgi:glycosyltransferase involved in cell wall biosynthesis
MGDSGKFQPLVSIVILSYNQERYIEQALYSALSHNYPYLEFVMADDASTDATPEIIRRVAEDNPHARLKCLFSTYNLGITSNCNMALRQCEGELIGFLGGDDIMLPGKIARQVEWFGTHPKGVLCGHAVEIIDASGQSIDSRYGKLGLHPEGIGACGLIKNGTPFPAVSVMVRRDRIPSYGFDERIPVVSDWKLWLDVVAMDGEYGFVEGRLAAYRRHAGNVTQSMNWRTLRDILLTALLWQVQWPGRCLGAWMHYFLSRVVKR